jgi:hypothetical protein
MHVSVLAGQNFFDGTTPLSHLYEIDIPTPLTSVWSDRIPRAELASREKKSDVEIEGMKNT